MARPTALERARLVIRGEHGELRLEERRITIEKQGAAPSRVSLSIDEIRGTALVTRTAGGRGWLHVNAVGGSPAPSRDLVVMTDPYTLGITGRAAGAAKRFARLVHQHLRARGMPPEPAAATASPPDGRFSSAVALTSVPPTDQTEPAEREDRDGGGLDPRDDPSGRRRNGQAPADLPRQLEQLADLHASGALTDQEFARLKARMLG